MLVDSQLVFSAGQAITSASTYTSTNVVDLTAARDVGTMDMEIVVQVGTAFSGGTNVQVLLVTSANSDLSSGTTIAQSPTYATAALTAGVEIARFEWPISLQGAQQRYIGLQYVSTGTYTAGTLYAEAVLDRRAFIPYASGLLTTGY